jgi:hypothetical protein
MSDRQRSLLRYARVRIKCAQNIHVGMWGLSVVLEGF